MAAPIEFDPLVELAGMWNTQLAERYLPIEGVPAAKYECVDGSLYVSPFESGVNSYAGAELLSTVRGPARRAGLLAYGTLNLAFGTGRWIEPDINILRAPTDRQVWISPDLFVLPIELVSAPSRRRDRIDKPAMCAAAGIPYYMHVEIDQRADEVSVLLLELKGDRYAQAEAAVSGELFETGEPFELSFDPAQLLEPRVS